MNPVKPPIPVEVKDVLSFTRLALALSEGSQILWHMKLEDKHVLALFTAYMYWEGDLPLLAYVKVDETPQPFLAYKSDSSKGEEWHFSQDADDTRYKYASFIQIKRIPKAFEDSIRGNYERPPEPMLAEVENINSIVRILLPLSLREGTVFPLWHFTRGEKQILGTCVPFEHYYESDALPVMFYVTNEIPKGPFVRYFASKQTGEKIDYSNDTSDAKYFYTKIVEVNKFPLFP
ncbi:MAG: hypothetical protein V1857_07320 [archaeon]